MTPADIPSLVAALREPFDQRQSRRVILESRTADLLEALSPKEAELVKPPREYEVSGDAVGGIPAGMVAWHGGDSAPEDWDGGHVARLAGVDTICVGPVGDHWSTPWKHTGNFDIIAYTPKVLTASHDAARERIARIISPEGWAKIDAGARGPWVDGVRADTLKQADAILAALPTIKRTDEGARLAWQLLESANHIAGVEHEATVSVMREAADWMLATPPTTDASEHMRETFNEGLWTGWRAGLAGEQMNDDYASTSWDVSDAAAQLDTASERMREAGQ